MSYLQFLKLLTVVVAKLPSVIPVLLKIAGDLRDLVSQFGDVTPRRSMACESVHDCDGSFSTQPEEEALENELLRTEVQQSVRSVAASESSAAAVSAIVQLRAAWQFFQSIGFDLVLEAIFNGPLSSGAMGRDLQPGDDIADQLPLSSDPNDGPTQLPSPETATRDPAAESSDASSTVASGQEA